MPQFIVRQFKKVPMDAYGLLALVLTWVWYGRKVMGRFFTEVYTSAHEIDSIGQFWMSWWAEKAIYSGDLSLFLCPLQNQPVGVPVFSFDLAYVHVLLSGLLRPLLGMAGTINLFFLLGSLGSLVGIYLLLRQFTKSVVAAYLMSLLPFIHALFFMGFVDLELVNMGYLGICLALWLKAVNTGTKGWIILAGISLALTCLTQMYYGIDALIFMTLAVVGAGFGVTPLTTDFKNALIRTGWVMGIGLGGALLWLGRSVIAVASIDIYKPMPLIPGTGLPEDVEIFLQPVHLLPLLAAAALVLIFCRRDKVAWFLLGALAVFSLLAFGPYMMVGDRAVPMPFWLMRQLLPIFWRLSMPIRFSRMAILVLAILLVYLHHKKGQGSFGSRPVSLLLVLALFWVGSLLSPMLAGGKPEAVPRIPTIATDPIPPMPQVFESWQKDKQPWAVFDLHCDADAQWASYFQIFHQRPISGTPNMTTELRQLLTPSETTALQWKMCAMAEEGQVPEVPSLKWLQDRNIGAVIIPRTYLDLAGQQHEALWDALLGPPAHFDHQVKIYSGVLSSQ